MRCILWFIHPTKQIGDNYKNLPKMHNLENLVLITEVENMIRINSSVRNVYTFLHPDFEGVDLYAARLYVHLTK